MINIDVVCPLYKADGYIDNLISSLQSQREVNYGAVVFAITEEGDTSAVKNKISLAGYNYFCVQKQNFSHSLTREEAIFNHCASDVVIMLSQDVKISDPLALYNLASRISKEVVYAYGRQVAAKKNIEYYVRKKNYGDTSYIVQKEDIPRLQLKAFFASDAFSAYHRPTFLSLGGYGGIPMPTNEDMFYSKKALDAGYKKAYVAEAVAEHSHKLTIKQLYKRYYDTGVWFGNHPEFDGYKTTDSGLKLALYVLGQSIIHFNIPALVRWLPDMAARYLGMKKGKKQGKKGS